MSKPSSNRPRVPSKAELQAAKRRSRLLLGVAVAVVVVAALSVAIATNSGSSSKSPGTTVAAGDVTGVVQAVTSVPASVQEGVGTESVKTLPSAVSGTALSVGGKPEVLYLGAEYCPFCAAERWPLAVALSRFGTFTGVGVTHSSSSDVYPNTPTLSFHGSTFTSDYLAFTPVEVATNQPNGSGGYTALDTPTAEQQAAVSQLSPDGSIPFVDFAGKYLISGASYDPSVLQGHSALEVATALSTPTSAIAKSVLGTANVITATLCQVTGNQPAAVCTAPAIAAIASRLTG
ncbi:MAG: hypothetical protein JWM34_2369 [Ilumatobacteraceae bacterium]|nr:hypothetical protein [Ilumatobacteraceae bacterium]